MCEGVGTGPKTRTKPSSVLTEDAAAMNVQLERLEHEQRGSRRKNPRGGRGWGLQGSPEASQLIKTMKKSDSCVLFRVNLSFMLIMQLLEVMN